MFASSSVREHLKTEWDAVWAKQADSRRLDLLEVGRTKLPEHKRLEGKRLEALAAEAGRHPADVLVDLALAEDLETQFVYVGAMNGDLAAVEQIVASPYCVPGVSDAGAHLDTDCGVDFTGVLLGYWVRERGVLRLEEAVRRLTSWPAQLLGVQDRGVLREGLAADIVVFDPATIRALPREIVTDLPMGGRRIIQRAEGIRAVIVNGEMLIDEGRHTGAMPGQLLRPRAAAPSR